MIVTGPIGGYSTQARISLDVARIINNGQIRFWFATEFNAITNAETSNPLRIFEELDRAAKLDARSSIKARSVADNLRRWIQTWSARGLFAEEETEARALQAVKTCFEDGGLHPSVFHLREIVGPVKESEPDEYRVENQPWNDPDHPHRVRQILPPL